ncbi:hypothetical protein [Aliarcobacter butzleri]|uniref:hypothetical protein n=1 Tax=Aliarcobacter butzleri TaxID=28197 RepID=UPI002B243ED7|nr:hypothetical protein [Aliarcobacter butzleri]
MYLISFILIIGSLFSFLFLGNAFDTTVSDNIKKTEEVEKSSNLMLFNGSRTLTKKSDVSDLSNVKMSIFSEDTHSVLDKERLDNFQKAIEVLVINEGNYNPTCKEIAETKLITESDCNLIKEKEYKAIKFVNNQIVTTNKNLLNIFENKNSSHLKFNDNDVFFIKNYNKEIMESDRESFKKNLEFTTKLQESFKFFDNEQELREYGKVLLKNYNEKNNIDIFTIYRLDLILNEIENREYEKRIKDAITNKVSEDEILKLKEINKNRVSINPSDYFHNESNFFETRLVNIQSQFK